MPKQVRHAYALDQLANGGAGQTIAIVVAYGSPSIQNDLNVFSKQFGLPATTITTAYGTRKPSKTDGGWALETSLDVEWVHAIAPNAKIVLSVAYSAGISDLLAAVDAAVKSGATVVSMSWGASEFSSESNYDSHFKKTGVTFVAASGDKGAGTSWPAISPSVTSVGGTTLSLDSSGNRLSGETGWSGSGGGFSAYFAQPAYQVGWLTAANRAFPDVAMLADPKTGVTIYDSTPYGTQTGWYQIGGTSASCPMWAAVIALANEQRVASGKTTLTGSNPGLYTIAGYTTSTGAPLYSFYYFDVTTGSNGSYFDTPYYDEVTGLGTPDAVNLVPQLTGL